MANNLASPAPASIPAPIPSRSRVTSPVPVLPHHKLHAFAVARDLLLAVLRCSIRDAKLRDEAIRSAKSACLNTAEGAGRVTRADKARAFAIARAETVEAAAAVEIAALCGDTSAAHAEEVARIADRLVAMLTGLVH
jgi:four helix bundle protein